MELAAALMDPRDTAHLSPPDQSLPPAPPISSSPALGACHPTFFPKYMSALEDFKMVVPDGRVNLFQLYCCAMHSLKRILFLSSLLFRIG